MYRASSIEIYTCSQLQHRAILAILENPRELHALNIIKTAGNICIDVTVRLVQVTCNITQYYYILLLI